MGAGGFSVAKVLQEGRHVVLLADDSRSVFFLLVDAPQQPVRVHLHLLTTQKVEDKDVKNGIKCECSQGVAVIKQFMKSEFYESKNRLKIHLHIFRDGGGGKFKAEVNIGIRYGG